MKPDHSLAHNKSNAIARQIEKYWISNYKCENSKFDDISTCILYVYTVYVYGEDVQNKINIPENEFLAKTNKDIFGV